MFVQLATLLTPQTPPPAPPQLTQDKAEKVFDYHPIQLSRFLEQVWVGRNSNLQILTPTKLEIPNVSPLSFELESLIEGDVTAIGNGNVDYPYPPPVWDHLIYAYMVENTRAYEIFRRVLEEYAYGERLGVASDAGQHWLRTTEALFYRDNPPFQIYSLASWIRPDIRAVRRNAYQRMFGLDLNHGTDDSRPYPYPRAAAANVEFSSTWEELLRQVWRAVVNIQNQVGPNETDITTIANLSRALFDMLRVRRQDNNAGNLGRDELFHVATMSWFHLTLMYNTPIVHDLKADATSPAERLQKIGERVGLPAHSRADSYFHLATSMSLVLREMELGTFNDTAGAPALFQAGKFQQAMQEATTHWSVATGRDVKARPVTVASSPPPPIRPTPVPMSSTSSRNGHRAHAPVRPQDTART